MTKTFYPNPHSWKRWLGIALIFTLVILSHLPAFAQDNDCAARAGTLDAIDVCLLTDQVILKATPRGDTVVPEGFEVRYVLTSGSGLIVEQVSEAPIFSVTGTPTGVYTLHTLVYDPATLDLSTVVPGQTSGFQLNELLIQGGGDICAALDVNGAKARFGTCEDTCFATAGKLKANNNDCLRNGKTTLTASVQELPIVPPGFTKAYVLTSGDDLIIEQLSENPSFEVTTTDKFTIHTLIYDANTLDLSNVELGVTSAVVVNQQLIQGGGTICGALDVAGASFNVKDCPPSCRTQAAKLKPEINRCLPSGKVLLTASITQNSIVPEGYQVRYLLTSGYAYIIQQIGTSPSFEVRGDVGLYTIHALVYDPNTLNLNDIKLGETRANDINRLLIQGLGSICGSLDLVGASFTVVDCRPAECRAKAGVLKPENYACLSYAPVTLKAKFWTYPTVPTDYKVIYFLASGQQKVILQKNTSPIFAVHQSGWYSIHTFVYDPNTFDLEDIELGSTRIKDIKEKLEEEGICAAIDENGATFELKHCVVCEADAGKIAPANDPCLSNYSATLKAKIIENPVVPNGFQVRYLLTSGSNMVIRNISSNPEFTVTSEGQYNIMTFVYNPSTFSLNSIYLNVTDAWDINEALLQGGGYICGALDLDGAEFYLDECQSYCYAEAGKLYTGRNKHCLDPKARLVALHHVEPTVPAGHKVVYLLTRGHNMVIEKWWAYNWFEVNQTGTYRIHTLVYDPQELNLHNLLVLGSTKLSSFSNLLKSTCAALDLYGVSFDVAYSCNAYGLVNEGNAYPNPATDVINVEFNKSDKINAIRVELVDVTGNVLKTWNFDGTTERTTLNISEITAGIYNLRIAYDDQLTQNVRVAKAAR